MEQEDSGRSVDRIHPISESVRDNGQIVDEYIRGFSAELTNSRRRFSNLIVINRGVYPRSLDARKLIKFFEHARTVGARLTRSHSVNVSLGRILVMRENDESDSIIQSVRYFYPSEQACVLSSVTFDGDSLRKNKETSVDELIERAKTNPFGQNTTGAQVTGSSWSFLCFVNMRAYVHIM